MYRGGNSLYFDHWMWHLINRYVFKTQDDLKHRLKVNGNSKYQSGYDRGVKVQIYPRIHIEKTCEAFMKLRLKYAGQRTRNQMAYFSLNTI